MRGLFDWMARLRAPSPLVILLLIAAMHGAYAVSTGPLEAPDTEGYVYWADRLIESGFAYPTLLAEADTGFPAILYALFATLIAWLRMAFGADYGAALVVINFAAHLALGFLLVRLAVRTAGTAIAGWAALLLFLGCQEIVRWVPFILSDATFVFLIFAVFSLAAARILDDSKGWLPVLPPVVAAIFYRPTGIVLLPDLAWAFFLSRWRGPLPSSRRALLTLAALAAVAILLFAWLVQDPGRWPYERLSGAFDMVGYGYGLGEVVNARPETWHLPPQSLLDIVLIIADRFAHFFAIGAASYSPMHWLASLAFFLPVYALAAWLCVVLMRADSPFGATERRVYLAAAGAVLSYAIFHALVQVDFDWRYRLPILPHLILLASGGVADLVGRLSGEVAKGVSALGPEAAVRGQRETEGLAKQEVRFV